MTKRFKGIAASDGVAIGKVYLFEKTEIILNEENILQLNCFVCSIAISLHSQFND